jgi:hypothetical protein
MIDLSRLPLKPKRVTASLNPTTGEISGSWVALHYDFTGPLCDLGLWIDRLARRLAECGLEVGEVSTAQTGIARTETEGVWAGTLRFGVACRPAGTPGPGAERSEG